MECLGSLRLAIIWFLRKSLQKIDGYQYFSQGQEITDFYLGHGLLLYPWLSALGVRAVTPLLKAEGRGLCYPHRQPRFPPLCSGDSKAQDIRVTTGLAWGC